MYDYELTDGEFDLGVRELVRDHSPRFWDVDAAEEIGSDPWEHPSWEVHGGWDDPEDVAWIVSAVVIEDARLTPSPSLRPVLAVVDDAVDPWMSRGWAA